MKDKTKKDMIKFFKPTVWKVVLTLIVAIFFAYFLTPIKVYTINDFTGGVFSDISLLSSKYFYIYLLLFLIFFYSFFSFIEWIINKRRGRG